jgi:predicted GTPase
MDTKNTKNILVVGSTGCGKSALCNVLTSTQRFSEGGYATSETRGTQEERFEFNETVYCVIDTVGIGSTNQTTREVLNTIINKMRSMSEKISKILLVTDGRFSREEIEIYNLLRDMFRNNHVTIVRTKFAKFQNRDECDRDRRAMLSVNRTIIESCKVIHVNNPSIGIRNDSDDSDDEMVELQNDINKKTRNKSRNILLNHLVTD